MADAIHNFLWLNLFAISSFGFLVFLLQSLLVALNPQNQMHFDLVKAILLRDSERLMLWWLPKP